MYAQKDPSHARDRDLLLVHGVHLVLHAAIDDMMLTVAAVIDEPVTVIGANTLLNDAGRAERRLSQMP